MTQGQLAWYRAMEDRGELSQITNVDELNRHVQRWRDNETHSCADWLRAEPGRRRLAGHPRAPRAGLRPRIAGCRTRALWPGRVRAGHQCVRRAWSTRSRAPARNGAIECHPRRDASLRRQPARRPRSLSRTRVGEPLQLPRASASPPTVLGRADSRAGSAGRGYRCGIRRVDAGPGWTRGTSTPESEGVTLETVANHVDHICQIAGNARHVGIGSDLDGAFGTEQCPADVNTIADLATLPGVLSARGYAPEDIENIAHGELRAVPAECVAGRWLILVLRIAFLCGTLEQEHTIRRSDLPKRPTQLLISCASCADNQCRPIATDSRSVSIVRGVRRTPQHFHSATGHG